MKNETRLRLSAFLLAAAILWTSCGGSGKATTMHLTRTDGTVAVLDENDRAVSPAENLGLYNGYRISTQNLSYAWMTLDQAKLAKTDHETQIEILKNGKQLEISLLTGRVFFNVTEPLADDETMDIRTSTTVTGIRGTCGWVAAYPDHSLTAVLEGQVECTAPDGSAVTVKAGMMAVLMNGADSFELRPITPDDIPGFVREEVPELTDSILNGGSNGPDETGGPEIDSGSQTEAPDDFPPFRLELPPIPDDGIERTVLTAENDEQLHELFAAGNLSNTEIHLTGGTYHGEHLVTDEMGNTYTLENLAINQYENLSLIGDGTTRLIVGHEDALIISAYECDNLLLYGLVLGHDVLPDVPCTAPVLSLSYCTNARIVGCDIFGCGLIGIQGFETTLTVQDSAIRDCSENAVLWSGAGSASFERCSLLGNGGPLFYIYNGGAGFTLTDCTIQDNPASQKRAYFDESAAGAWNETGTVESGNGWQ